jgi:hypothetical protein
MTVTAASFRVDFPLFVSTVTYPDASVTFYINLAVTLLNPDRWGESLDYGTELMVAHFLTLDAMSATGMGIGGLAGTAIGVLSGGSVDKVSYTKDVESAMEPNAGHWNMTTYGLIFIRLLRMFGAGPVQIGIDPFSGFLNGPAWPGPIYGPF